MFTELFSNVNIDSIQETYPKINVYNKEILQYVKETTMKYGLNLKLTKLEALEVGLWARTFQVACYEEGPQLPNKQWSEPPKSQQQHTPTHINEPPVTEQWVETGQKTCMAAQWSCTTAVVSLIIGERNGPQMQQVRQGQHGIEHSSILGLCSTQVNMDRRFPEPSPCFPASANTINVSHSCSLR